MDVITAAEIAGEVERTRLSRLLDLKRRIERDKLEFGCLSSQVRAQMNRDGVVKHKIPGVGTATLLPGREIVLCEHCNMRGTLDPYLKIEPEKA